MKKLSIISILVLTLAMAAFALVFYFGSSALWMAISAAALALFGALSCVSIALRRTPVSVETDSGLQNKLNGVIEIPMALLDQRGVFEWSNSAFDELCKQSQPRITKLTDKIGKLYKITELVPDYDPRFPQSLRRVSVASRVYDLHSCNLYAKSEDKPRKLCFTYWIDKTEEVASKARLEDALPSVMYVQIDNYEEISESNEIRERHSIAAVERLISTFAQEHSALVRRYDSGKWLIICERASLMAIQKKKFHLLDSVRELDTGIRKLSLSMGVGAEETIARSSESAIKALELAQGRGGDQAVVRSGGNHSFYGGKRQSVERHSKVKSRVFSSALKNLIAQSGRVLIMGHRQGDMDCVGAALGLVLCCRALKKPVNVVYERNNVMIESFSDELKARKEYEDVFVTPEDALGRCGQDTLLIIVDTHRPKALSAPELYGKCSMTVVIDHHRRSTDAIPDATLSYLDPSASSTSELITEIIQYFDPSVKPSPYESAVLLAGVTIDTKGFAFNSGVRTFEAASYLRRCGADPGYVKRFFQDDLSTFNNRALVVQSAEMIAPGFALAHCPENLPNQALVAAQAADALTTIRGILAAFVLAHSKDGIIVSGRSIGEINVQIILEAIGGGGHLNVSGAQLTGSTYEQARERVIEAVKKYCEEEKQ